jgi:hypothetical protein
MPVSSYSPVSKGGWGDLKINFRGNRWEIEWGSNL